MSYQQSFEYIQQSRKRRGLQLLFGIGVAILITIVVFGYTLLNQSPGSQIVKVGQILTINNMDATLIGVGQLTLDPIASEDIAVRVELTNHSGSEQQYNPLDFHVKSGTGSITDLEAIPPDSYQSNSLLRAGSLSAGGTVQGDIIFQVQTGDHQAELLWRPGGSSGENGWNLGL